MIRKPIPNELMRRLRVVVLGCAAVFWSVDCPGAFSFTGSFQGNPGQGVPVISGSFSGLFDDSVVPAGYSGEFEIPLLSVGLNPNPLGATTFALNSVGATLVYNNGVLSGLGLGGYTALNSIRSVNIDGSEDDFAVIYVLTPTPVIAEVSASVASVPSAFGTDLAPAGSLVITVPEPSSMHLVVVALCIPLLLRRQRISRPNRCIE